MKQLQYFDVGWKLVQRYFLLAPYEFSKTRGVILCGVLADSILLGIGNEWFFREFFKKSFYSLKAARQVLYVLDYSKGLSYIAVIFSSILIWAIAEALIEVKERRQLKRPLQMIVLMGVIALGGLLVLRRPFLHVLTAAFQLSGAVCSLGIIRAWKLGLGRSLLGVLIVAFSQVLIPWAMRRGFRILLGTPVIESGIGPSLESGIEPRSEIDTTPVQSMEEISSYLKECENRIDPFCKSHFSFLGVFQLHKMAFGVDFILNPLNFLLSIPMLSVRKATDVLSHAGWDWPKSILSGLPTSFRTRVRSTIEDRILSEIFLIDRKNLTESQKKVIRKQVANYSSSRATVSDIAASSLNVWLAMRWFGKAGVSPLELGRFLASNYAKENAESKFFLGKKLGSIYYGIFPVAPSKEEIIGGVIAVVALMTVVSQFSGWICDLIQGRLGLHRRKLKIMIRAIQDGFILDGVSGGANGLVFQIPSNRDANRSSHSSGM